MPALAFGLPLYRDAYTTVTPGATHNEDSHCKRLHPHRTADRGGHHRHHRGDCGAGSAARPHVGQRSVGDRFAAGGEQRRSELLVELCERRLRRRPRGSRESAGRQQPGVHQPRSERERRREERLHGGTGGEHRRPEHRQHNGVRQRGDAAGQRLLGRRDAGDEGRHRYRNFGTDTRGTIWQDTSIAQGGHVANPIVATANTVPVQ